jgi:hypothetical protein
LYRYVTLVDPSLNQFEVVVCETFGMLCFAQGIGELNQAYGLKSGAWITLIAIKPQLFVIWVNDRHDMEIKYPKYDTLLTLRLERSIYVLENKRNESKMICYL